MIDFDFIKECCGCGACVDSCPRQCIELVCSPYGYMIPKVNTDDCINCNKCERVCPILHAVKKESRDHLVFSAYNKAPQWRNAGSSGSVFCLLATSIIEKGGCVYGAAFDDSLTLKHTKAENAEALIPLLKSKYIQSETVGIFNQVQQDLSSGRTVLFVGTPCQTNALYGFVPERLRPNLYLVDFVCHGVPGQELFNKSIASFEKRKKCHVNHFSFRVKGKRHSKYYTMDYTDRSGMTKNETGDYSRFPYYRAYMLYHCFRQSCYRCKFVGLDRVSDLTLADFWGINKLDPSVKDQEKGYSMLILNSEKGKKLFDSIKDSIVYEHYGIEDAINNNYSYTKVTKDTWLSKSFRWSYKNLPFSVVEKVFFSMWLSYYKRGMGKLHKW